MRRSRGSSLVAGAAAGTALACTDAGGPTATPPSARLLGPAASATYVLASAGASVEPVVRFDHVCPGEGGAGAVRRTSVEYDTLHLRADGTASRSTVVEFRTDDGAPPARWPTLVMTGTWEPAAFPSHWAYFGGKSGVTLKLPYADRTGASLVADMHLVLDAAGRLTTPMGMGGTCAAPGAPNDSRTEVAVYTRR